MTTPVRTFPPMSSTERKLRHALADLAADLDRMADELNTQLANDYTTNAIKSRGVSLGYRASAQFLRDALK